MLQEAKKRILTQELHPYKVYNKSYKKSYFHVRSKSYFTYFQPHSIRKPFKTISKYQVIPLYH